jgi:hypothetical protein
VGERGGREVGKGVGVRMAREAERSVKEFRKESSNDSEKGTGNMCEGRA